jgi:hypothetical protein
MSIFDINNPRHKQILLEELARAKSLMEQSYSADAIWKSMNSVDRKEALYVAKEPNPDKFLNSEWDNIPADLQDLIDLGDYELASSDQGGRSMLRGINKALSSNPNADKFVAKFLKRVGRNNLQDITVKQAYKLNPALWQYIESQNTDSMPKAGASSGIDPYDRENPSRGAMGSTYRGD